MNRYHFYGNQGANITPEDENNNMIINPRFLYDMLSEIWCEYTCAPRMRKDWSKQNMTLGQCSITAFLVQDIFGGKVYGILRPGGNYHCYNVVGDCVFDLTSEQFGEEAKSLVYENNPEQFREVHFAKEEKYQRYLYLKAELEKRIFRPGDIVKHFKREFVDQNSKEYLYEILTTAHHSETDELLMVYKALYPPYKVCARPLEMFISKVDKVKYPEAGSIYRFEKTKAS